MGIFDRFRGTKQQQQEDGESELLSNAQAAGTVSPTLDLTDVPSLSAAGEAAKPFGGEALGQEDRDRLYNPYEGMTRIKGGERSIADTCVSILL